MRPATTLLFVGAPDQQRDGTFRIIAEWTGKSNETCFHTMLFTFHVSSGTKSYVTQHQADDWQGAKEALIASEAFRQFAEAAMPLTVGRPIADSDIVLMVPMAGLKHCWLMQGGRAGEYFTAVVVRTDDTGEVEVECDL